MVMKQGTYREVVEDIKQCLICGYSEAVGESKLHSISHNRFSKAKQEHGEHLLSFEKLLESEKGITELINLGKNYLKSVCSGDGASDYILDKIYTVQFTKSIKFWDYFRPHPQYEDYITLLWNTPKFITYISSFVDKDVIDDKIEYYRSNRKLKMSDIFVNEFVFLNVEQRMYTEEELEFKSNIKDLSNLDNILIVDCDEEFQEVEEEDIDATTNIFKALITNIVKESKS